MSLDFFDTDRASSFCCFSRFMRPKSEMAKKTKYSEKKNISGHRITQKIETFAFSSFDACKLMGILLCFSENRTLLDCPYI